MFRIILFLLLILPINAFAYQCNADIDKMASEYNIHIFCDSKNSKSPNITGEIPNKKLLNEFSPFLKIFLNSYNHSLLEKNIEEIFILEDLRRNGYEVGGVSNGRQIFVCLDKYSNPEAAYMKILHHEFSSNIYKANDLNSILKWKSISKDKYDYSESFNIKCINDFKFAFEQDTQINSDGFVANYGRTNEENDFNTYAEVLFIRTYEIKRLNQYPKFREKFSLLKTFYRNAGYTGKFPDET